eukprot:6236575-Amphidinium_carterae.1
MYLGNDNYKIQPGEAHPVGDVEHAEEAQPAVVGDVEHAEQPAVIGDVEHADEVHAERVVAVPDEKLSAKQQTLLLNWLAGRAKG